MAEYLDREALEAALNHRLSFLLEENSDYTNGFDEAVTRVENFSSVDVVPVVRCKDCKHKVQIVANGIVLCSEKRGMIRPTENDFCSYGERRESEDG